jgi:mRNA interferase RelE/StbE
MNWKLEFLPEVEKDFRQLSGDQRILVRKAIKKVQTNPLPMNEGGYGKPLGNKGGTDLTGFLKIKLRGCGLRVVYKLVRTESELLIVVVGARADDEVYETAEQRVKKYGY